jgi:hypothetical protein
VIDYLAAIRTLALEQNLSKNMMNLSMTGSRPVLMIVTRL